jgi:nicotinamidase-related amidase
MANTLPFGPIGKRAVHICVDMQRMFADETEWQTPWMKRVLPNVVALAAARPERTIFTRFIPARRPGEGRGAWARYWRRWASITLEQLEPGGVDLVPDLARYCPPGELYDKIVYSPWHGDLDVRLQARGVDTLIVSGGETEVCVLATVLGAVDLGYRVVIATDALCSSSDETHDAAIDLYHRRYGTQVEPAETATILAAWGCNGPETA